VIVFGLRRRADGSARTHLPAVAVSPDTGDAHPVSVSKSSLARTVADSAMVAE